MSDWQPIETAPKGDEQNGPFFDVIWADQPHAYLPVLRRVMNCFRSGSTIACKHGYPAVLTIFNPPPTHWLAIPDLSTGK